MDKTTVFLLAIMLTAFAGFMIRELLHSIIFGQAYWSELIVAIMSIISAVLIWCTYFLMVTS